MKNFNVNATSLIITFTCEGANEEVCLEINDLPEPNWFAETCNGNENCEEKECEDEYGHTYRVVVYKNINEGNVEVFDTTDDEYEIDDFEIEDFFSEE